MNSASKIMRNIVPTLRNLQQSSIRRSFNTSVRRLDSTIGPTHRPSDFDKKMLVYAKMYKSAAEVPEVVTSSQIKKARDLFRIRVSLGMCLATFFGCIIMVYSGKKAMKEGDSLHKRGLDWQKQLKEKAAEEKKSN
ncbi:DgyrCDS2366 [Dimorphilus gyrociliatus]|uniref:DgyrCDS2366 n=1 Tax=Dimorphilus gyrociliatus TaxID=2664684 RepID=A0A7I8VA27_9ANNE|nr:DgyrCDS2366 [Dimorphilus gyrociliatus]